MRSSSWHIILLQLKKRASLTGFVTSFQRVLYYYTKALNGNVCLQSFLSHLTALGLKDEQDRLKTVLRIDVKVSDKYNLVES